MNIDLLPVSGFALESFVPPAAVPGDPQTLTLQLALGTTKAGANPMAGSATSGQLVVAPPGTERAAILLTDVVALTITF
jgi:hypothetical protein